MDFVKQVVIIKSSISIEYRIVAHEFGHFVLSPGKLYRFYSKRTICILYPKSLTVKMIAGRFE